MPPLSQPEILLSKESPIEGADILIVPRYWPMAKEIWADVSATFNSFASSLEKVERRGLHVDQRVLKGIKDCEKMAAQIVKGER